MKRSIYLVGKHDICKVLTHFFEESSVLVVSRQSYSHCFIKDQTPEDATIIIILSGGVIEAFPPAYLDGGRVVSCLFIDTVEEANQWVRFQRKIALQRAENISILAQWNPHYLKQGSAWINVLSTQLDSDINNWMADAVGKTRLLGYLQGGVHTCLYFGHGRQQKIVGYHGISANELIDSNVSISCFLSFSCYHLHQDSNQPSLGKMLVEANKVGAFWGSRVATNKMLNVKLGKICRLQFSEEKNITIADWIRSVGKEIEKAENLSLRPLWEGYSLVGNPLQLLKGSL